MICKRWSFECDIGKYSTFPKKRCEDLGEYSFRRTCAVCSHIAQNWTNVCILSHDKVSHDITDIYCSSNPCKHDTLTQCWAGVSPPSTTPGQHQPSIVSTCRVCWDYCDMGWYPYTSHSGNHCTECENKPYQTVCWVQTIMIYMHVTLSVWHHI